MGFASAQPILRAASGRQVQRRSDVGAHRDYAGLERRQADRAASTVAARRRSAPEFFDKAVCSAIELARSEIFDDKRASHIIKSRSAMEGLVEKLMNG